MFTPHLEVLPQAQRALWDELGDTPDAFVLYGGTGLAIQLGHRASNDFDFFSNASFDPQRLERRVPYLRGAERVQVDRDTLTCRVDRGGPVLVSFFGGLGLGRIAPPVVASTSLRVASLHDIAATKAVVVAARAEAKDYLDLDALIRHGVTLPAILAAGATVYGDRFNGLLTLKALAYFGDVPSVAEAVRVRLAAAVAAVDLGRKST